MRFGQLQSFNGHALCGFAAIPVRLKMITLYGMSKFGKIAAFLKPNGNAALFCLWAGYYIYSHQKHNAHLAVCICNNVVSNCTNNL